VILLLWAACLSRGSSGRWWRGHVAFWVVASVYVIGTRSLIGEAFLDAPVRTMVEQVSTQFKAVAYYARLIVVPHGLNVEHQFAVGMSLVDATVLLSAGVIGSLGYLVWRSLVAGMRQPVFWFVWMVVSLSPTFLVPLNVMVAERRLYMCLIGAVALVVWVVRQSGLNLGRLLPAPIILFGVLTVQRNEVWATEHSLWSDTVQKSPGAVRPHLRLGTVYGREGEREAALKEYERALELDPGNGPALNNIGNLHRANGESDLAEGAYLKALEGLPRYPEALINLGALYNSQGRFQEALQLFERAADLTPDRPELLNNLGITYLELRRYREAEAAFQKAVEQEPLLAKIHFNLGGALEGLGRSAEAVSAYERATQLRRDYAKPYYKLSVLYAALGRQRESLEAERMYRGLSETRKGSTR
jgi:Tfp pilus assembly protein PilF